MISLINRDSKGKIRVAEIQCEYKPDLKGYLIERTTFQYGGKKTKQPDILIQKGKASRTLNQQAELECNSIIKGYMDKGYKRIPGSVDEYAITDLEKILPEFTTDSNGFAKHMLAKPAKDVKDSTIEKVERWWVSRKIDGVRCSFYWDGNEIKSASRGGGHYDFSTSHFRKNPKLIEYFKEHPDTILDGELFKMGKSLQQISGAARLEKNAYDCDWLEYYVYDIMTPNVSFDKRLEMIQDFQKELNLGFDPERDWEEGELQIQIVPHVLVEGKNKKEQIIKLHDQYVSEGWEGCVARDASKAYKFGSRGSEMIKFKQYQDAEFEITGISEGLREEDMCFTCITDSGIEFKAKPMGSRELKQQYREDIDKLIGKMATVKFFYYSDDGTPLQPVLKAIRDYE